MCWKGTKRTVPSVFKIRVKMAVNLLRMSEWCTMGASKHRYQLKSAEIKCHPTEINIESTQNYFYSTYAM